MVFERTPSNKVFLKNIPVSSDWDDIQNLFSSHGGVIHVEKVSGGKQGETYDVLVIYDTQEKAHAVAQKLNGYEVQGYFLEAVCNTMDKPRGSRSPRGGGRGFNHKSMPYSGNRGSPLHGSDFPLRILVVSDMVGAIIGRSGETIRQITQQSRARVDIHRKENSRAFEKDEMYPVQVITIYGNPENCSLACQKILEVMQQEANNTNRGEVQLKILAHNNLIGRIIGKNGNTIKRIMETTDTKVSVSSSVHDMNSYNFERVITVKGKLENICKAEQMISSKLRQCYENDMAAMQHSAFNFPGSHQMRPHFSAVNQGYPPNNHLGGGPPPPPYGMYGNPQIPPYNAPMLYSPGVPPPNMEQLKETVHLYIPNSAVGAIIGTGGSTIKNMISSSGAMIRIEQTNKEEQIDPQAERKVTITGSPHAQSQAQYMIFKKASFEARAGTLESYLKVEIFVPSNQVGRIIGKGGQTVRELQRETCAIIKLIQESENTESEETAVHIIGDYYSTQAAQHEIRQLLNKSPLPNLRRPPPLVNMPHKLGHNHHAPPQILP